MSDADNDGDTRTTAAEFETARPSTLDPLSRLRVLKTWFRDDSAHSAEWRTHAKKDFDFKAGHQWEPEEKSQLNEQMRPEIVFNRSLAFIKVVAGFEINGRHETIFLPRNIENTAVNELLTGASKWMADDCDAEDEESEAFQDTLTCGMGWCEAKLSYEQDAAGLYDQPQVNPLEMYWDYRARKRNLVDCKRVARLRTLPVGDAKEMFPGKDVEELDAKWALGLEPEEQTKTLEEKRIREENAGDNYVEKYEVHIVQMQWSERVPYWLVADPQENTKITLSDAKYKVLKERMDSLGIPLIAVKIFKREFFQSFLGRDELEFNNAPIPDRFSFECITGEQDRNKGTWFGLIRMLRDPQKWANKWLSQTLHIMNANAKGGIMAEPDAFDDQRQAEESYARPEAITWMKKGALSASNPKWVKKPVADFPNGFFQLMEFAISSLPSVVGINLEILGQKDIMQPGVLEAQRKQAAMTVLATMFDSLRRFRKRVGRIRLYYIQNYLSDGRLIRIAGQEGAKVVPLLKDKCLGEYDVVVDDAPTSPNQKQANWALIAPLLPAFKDQLVANPQMLLAILEYSPLPSRLVEQMRLVLAQPNPQQQAQQQMQQLGLAALIARINKDQSTAEMQNAKAGATQATAMYDLAMARNLLQKNGFDQVASHLDALQKIADITKTSAETEHAKAKTGGQHLSNLIDALTPIPAAPQAQAQQVQDQQAA